MLLQPLRRIFVKKYRQVQLEKFSPHWLCQMKITQANRWKYEFWCGTSYEFVGGRCYQPKIPTIHSISSNHWRSARIFWLNPTVTTKTPDFDRNRRVEAQTSLFRPRLLYERGERHNFRSSASGSVPANYPYKTLKLKILMRVADNWSHFKF